MSPDTSDRPTACWVFVRDQVLTAPIGAAFARARIYQPGVTEEDAGRLRGFLRQQLLEIAARYEAGSTSDDDHVAYICELAETVSKECGDVLLEGRFRIGIAQKALNLYLKYLWCLGRIPEPPHCPFDGVVISRLPLKSPAAWTRTDSVDDYCAWVRAAKKAAGSQSLARWELELWNRIGRP